MLFAVTIEELGAIFFLTEHPGPGWGVQEGVELDIPTNYTDWPENAERPRPLLGVSCDSPNHYKVVRNRRDLGPAGYRATGKDFGGLFSRTAWERFAAAMPAVLAGRDVPDDEPPGATESAIEALRRGR